MNVDGYIHGDAATPCVEIMCIDSVECEPVNIRNFIKTQGSKYCQSNFLYRCILGLRYPAKALMFKWL